MKRFLITSVLSLLILAACNGNPVDTTPDSGALAIQTQQSLEQTLAAATPTVAPTPTATPLPVKKIALLSSESGSVQLYTIASDGSGLARVTNNPNVEGTYDYSPDGQWIAYETYIEADGSAEIYVMRADGSEVRKLVSTTKNDFNPAWSPDGSKLLFMSDMTANGHDRDIFVVNADGSGLFNLSSSSNFDVEPAWSPDGTRIAYRSGVFLSDEDLADFSVSGSTTRIVIKNVATGARSYLPLPEDLVVPSYPRWSPDGTRILFNCGGSMAKPDDPESYATYQGTCLAAVDGSGVEVLYAAGMNLNANEALYHPDAVWSPDGSRIAFIGLLEDMVTSEVFTMAPDGSDIQQLTHSTTDLKTSPAWSKDGGMILFLTKQGSASSRRYVLYAMNADGSGMLPLFERTRRSPMPLWLE